MYGETERGKMRGGGRTSDFRRSSPAWASMTARSLSRRQEGQTPTLPGGRGWRAHLIRILLVVGRISDQIPFEAENQGLDLVIFAIRERFEASILGIFFFSFVPFEEDRRSC